MYRWVHPSPINTAFLLRLPLYWPSRLGSSFPHIPKALTWNCSIKESHYYLFCSVPLNFIFSIGLKLSRTITSRSFWSVISPCFSFSAVASRPFFTSKPTVALKTDVKREPIDTTVHTLMFVIQNNSHVSLCTAHGLNYKLNSLIAPPFYNIQSFIFS